jgi:hypothetical protein
MPVGRHQHGPLSHSHSGSSGHTHGWMPGNASGAGAEFGGSIPRPNRFPAARPGLNRPARPRPTPAPAPAPAPEPARPGLNRPARPGIVPSPDPPNDNGISPPGYNEPDEPAPAAGPDPVAEPEPEGETLSDLTISALVHAVLNEYGLAGVGLETMVETWIRDGVTDSSLLRTLIENTQQFRDRFPAMALRHQQGYNRITAAEYIAFEDFAVGLFQEGGLPPGFYDQRSDFTDLIARFPDLNMARQSLQRRVSAGFGALALAPPEIRDAFGQYFGPSGDAALAAYMIDPDKAVDVLLRQVELAEVGGTGSQFGFNVGLDVAGQLVDRGIDRAAARSGFGQVQELEPAFRETISETEDFTAETEGFGSIFNLDNGESLDRLRRRVEARSAAFRGSGGFMSNQGGGLAGLRAGR